MHKLIQISLAAAILGLSGGALAAEGDTHTTHSKQMKNDQGVKDGEEMKNTGTTGTGTARSAASKRCSDEGKTHTTHSKQMKNDAGVKEGAEMDDADCAETPAQAVAKKPAGKDTHSTHSKQMKNDTGVKDGEPMEDAAKP